MEKFRYISKFIVEKIGLIIVFLSFIAFLYPNGFKWMLNYTAIFLGLAMFGMGTNIDISDFKRIFKRPKPVIIGVIAQYTIMPLAAFFLAKIFNLNTDLALGVILVGCCPGGTASNVITHIAKGDVPMSVSMTIVSTLIAPIMTPLLVFLLAGKWVEVKFVSMFLTVVKIILIPVLMGIFINNFAKSKVEKVKEVFPLISSLAIILIIAGIIGANREKILTCGFLVLVVVMLHNFIGLYLGLAVSKIFKMEYNQGTALAIEVGMQNSGLAISLATVNFALNPLATLPGAIFSIWHNVSGSFFASVRRNSKIEEKIEKTYTKA